MMRRALAVSALLGLPAAFLAHAVVFHGGHVAGGGAHAVLVDLSIICMTLAVTAALAAALRERIGRFAPSYASVIASTAAWFVLIELREHPHAIPALPSLAAVCFAACIVAVVWRGFTRVAADVVLEFFVTLNQTAASPRSTIFDGLTHPAGSLAPAYSPLFSRPPPA